MNHQYLALSELAKEGSVIIISYVNGQFRGSLLGNNEDTHIHMQSETLKGVSSLLEKAALDIIKIRYCNQSLAFLRRMISSFNDCYQTDLSLLYQNSTQSIEIVDNDHLNLSLTLNLNDIDTLVFSKYTRSHNDQLNHIITAFLTITSCDNLLDEIRANDIVFGVIE